MRAPLLLLIGLTWMSAFAPCAAGQADDGEPGSAIPGVEELLEQLGDPARLEAAMRLVREMIDTFPAKARAIAEGLAARGGHASAQALLVLARHRDASVRFVALRGIAEVAIRRADGIEAVRAALLDRDADARGAGYLAIARVGDGSDLPALLEAFASNDPRTRTAADRALSTLTGISMPLEDPNGWSEWWRSAQSSLPVRLEVSIHRLDLGGDRVDVRDARRLLAQFVWFDVDRVQAAALDWLRSSDARRRGEGYRVAAQCRLGELADDVRRAARDELEPDRLFIALCCAKVLGVEVEGITLPATLGDAAALLEDDADPAAAEATVGVDLARFVQERIRLGEQALVATTDPALRAAISGGGHGGGLGGGAVWLDLDAKRERARGSGVKRAAVPVLRPTPPPSSWPLGWLGFPLVAVAIVLAVLHDMRRRRREELEDRRPVWGSLPPGLGEWMDEGPVETALGRALRSVALHPDALAAAAVRPRKVPAVVSLANVWFLHNERKLRELQAKALVARNRRDRMKGLVKHQMASPDELAWFAQADAECAQVEPELAAACDALFEAATAALSTESKATLVRIRANGADGSLPVYYLVVERTEEERVKIGEALRHEMAANQKHAELEPRYKSLLQNVRNDLAVWHAQHDSNELLEEVAAKWESAVAAAAAAAASRFSRETEREEALLLAKMNAPTQF